MTRLTLIIEAPDIVIDLLARALTESDKVLLTPETIAPGYIANVVSTEVS